MPIHLPNNLLSCYEVPDTPRLLKASLLSFLPFPSSSLSASASPPPLVLSYPVVPGARAEQKENIYSSFPNSLSRWWLGRHRPQSSAVGACSRCLNRIPGTVWLKQQRLISLQCWRRGVQDKMPTEVVHGKSLPPSYRVASHCVPTWPYCYVFA